jgi:NADH:ubiquinone oxidoreductase subunit E
MSDGRAATARFFFDRARQRRIAAGAGLLFVLVGLVCTTVLVVDYVVARRVQAEKEINIAALGEQTGTDVAAVTQLHEERERLTASSLAREGRNRFLAWCLLAVGGLGIACGRWRAALEPASLSVPLAPTTAGPGVAVAVQAAAKTASGGGQQKANLDPIDLRPVDELVRRLGSGHDAAIPILQAIQAHYRYLPDEALQHLCRISQITPAQIAGTSSFYAQFRRTPVGEHLVRVCHGTACHVAGAERVSQELRRYLQILPGQDTDPSLRFTLESIACLGCCSLAPVMTVAGDAIGHLTPARALEALDVVGPQP